MSEYTKDWISDIVEKTVEKYNKRTVVLWGDYETSYIIRNRLKEKQNIDVGFFVDSDNGKVDGVTVLPISILNGKNEEYFIIIPIAFYQSLKDTLEVYQYTTDDYYYFCDCLISKTQDYYEDSHGNKIIGNYRNAKIVFSGFDAVVTIGKGFKCQSGTVVYVHSNAKVSFGVKCRLNGILHIRDGSTFEIGNNFQSGKNTEIELKGKAKLKIGDDCIFLNDFNEQTVINISYGATASFGNNIRISGTFAVRSDANLKIGNDFTININSQILVLEHTEMIIGDDCMFSHDLAFYTNDAHSIFDVKTGRNINSTPDISSKRKITIGNHVWIGARSIVLYNTTIGDGSIIGAGSIVKNKIPNNCIAVGTPARVIRRNVVWSRENCSDNIEDCWSEYINMTEE
jgi:acetyltransferase-like isoleucine patch superfamily enzyme